MSRFKILIILLLFNLPFSSSVWAGTNPQKVERVRQVKTVTAEMQDVTYEAETTGSLVAEADVDLTSEVDGVIKEIHFEEGETVKVGALLLTIKDEEYMINVQESRAKLNRAIADLSFAKKVFKRTEQLFRDNVVSGQERDDAKAKFDMALAARVTAQAELDMARKNLKDTKVLAPISGIVSKRFVDVGEYVKEGDTKLLNIVQIDPIKVEFSIPEKYFSNIGKGQNVLVLVESQPQEEFVGEIYYVNPKILPENRRFQCYARIKNTEGKLRPGFFVITKIAVAHHPDSIVIPDEAVITEEGVNYCFIVENQRAKKVVIKTGIRLRDGTIEVVEGLKAGTPVVVRGQYVLLDEDKVEAEPLKVVREEQ